MRAVVIELAKKLTSTIHPLREDDDSLMIACEIIDKIRINGFIPSDPRVTNQEFDDLDIQTLREALKDYARQFPDHPTRSLAYCGLAALRDPNELYLLRDILEIESTKEIVDEDALWQIMIALDNIGEDVLKPLQSNQAEQAGDRWAAARLYLSRKYPSSCLPD